MIPENIQTKAAEADERLGAKAGYTIKDMSSALETIFRFGHVEIGWRESCGKTDVTMVAFREWKKIVSALRKIGFEIAEENIKHGNAWATKCGGFWSSIRYSLANKPVAAERAP